MRDHPQPKLQIVRVVQIACVVCGRPIADGDIVSASGTDQAHARCVVVVVEPDGSKTGTRHPLSIEMTRAQWYEVTHRKAAAPENSE